MTTKEICNYLQVEDPIGDIEVLTENEEEIIRIDKSEHGIFFIITDNSFEREERASDEIFDDSARNMEGNPFEDYD